MEAEASPGWLLEIREYWRRLIEGQDGGITTEGGEVTAAPEDTRDPVAAPTDRDLLASADTEEK